MSCRIAALKACAVLGLLVAQPAFADESGEWSMGAGLGGGLLLETAPVGVGTGAAAPPVTLPSVQVNVEKKMGPRASLMLGITGSYSDASEPFPLAATGRSQVRRGSSAASAGMRFRVTGDDALVDVTVFGALHVGYAAVTLESVSAALDVNGSVISSSTVSDVVGGGMNAGFSVERMLMDRLSVRINASVFQATYSDVETRRTSAQPEVRDGGSVFSANLSIRPGIEMRLYF